jgi:hypothetical protein
VRPVRSLATLLLLVVTLAAPGCSFGLSGPDPERPRDELPKCSTGKGAVFLDGLMATLLGVGGLAAVDDDSSTGAALVATGALFAASAYRGNRVANECREAFDEYAQRVSPMPYIADRPATRPVIARPVVKKPVATPSAPAMPDVQADVRVPEPAPQAEEPVAEPPQVPPVPRPKAPPKPKPAGEDDWSAFWRETP